MQLRTLAALAAFAVSAPLFSAQADYYPTRGWRESTPEAQGLDSQALAQMVDNVSRKRLNVHSVTVIRHGYVVLDAYFYPFRPNTVHDVASVTKSITAALVGIAADKGLLTPDRKLLSFFPDEAPKDPEPRKQAITVADLLSMQPGLDCGFAPGERELEEMRRTTEWVKYALALPMKYDPGVKFGYCSPGYHLLSSIVTAAAHQPLAEFAKANLFEPLGIHDVIWPPDDQGRTHGWGDSHFTPRDFGKIGYLYLHDGVWDGKQVVSKEWVRRSITKQADPGRGAFTGYGSGWWLANTSGMEEFGGNGRGGQRVAVWPEKDMIVIITGGGYPANEVMPGIVAAIKSDQPLAAGKPATETLLRSIAEAAKTPPATPAPDLPAMAKTVSGAKFAFPRNPSRLDSIQVTFNGKSEAQLKVGYLGGELSFPVGLDGVYRLGPYGPFGLPAGATGRWTADGDFEIDLNFIAKINRYSISLHFDGDRVEAAISESSGLIRNGKVEGKKI